MSGQILQIRLSLKGRPIRSFTFSDEVVTVGRDPGADIFLDNSGVSRRHAIIKRVATGHMIVDLNSANGTYLNDERVNKAHIEEDDIIRIGKFSLWINFKDDQRHMASSESANPAAIEGTTVLSTDQLARMMSQVKKSEDARPEFKVIEAPKPVTAALPQPAALPEPPSRPSMVLVLAATFLIGLMSGVVLTRLLLSRF